MTQELWVPGPLPGMNEVIAAAKGSGGRGRAYAAMKADWTDRIFWLAKAAKLQPVGPVVFEFTWFEATRKRDPDNVSAAKKFILDGLVKAGVLQGDGWAHVIGFSDRWFTGVSPGCRVYITEP